MNTIEIIPQGINSQNIEDDINIPKTQNRRANEEIEQQNWLRQRTRYGYFFNRHYFSVTESDTHGGWSQEQVVDVRFLEATPQIQIKLPVATIATSMVLFALSFIGFKFLEMDWRFAISPGLVGLLFFTFVPRLSSIKSVWQSKFGHTVLLEMYHNLPNRLQFNQLVELIESKIQQGQLDFTSKKNRLVEELKEHRRLLKSGHIDQMDYEQAKIFILQEHEKLD